MKRMFVAAVMVVMAFLAGCSDDKFAMEATPGQQGAGSTVTLDGKEGVMTIVPLTPHSAEGVKYHVTKTNEGALVKAGNAMGYKMIELHVKELKTKLNFIAVPQQGYLCADCVWLKLPQNWAVKSVQ
jgi:hypothetical protein